MTTPNQTTTATPWAYEADMVQDHGGEDVFHHIVSGERHVAEVDNEADAHFIVEAVNKRTEQLTSPTPIPVETPQSGPELHVTLCTTQNLGDHAQEVRLAYRVEPGETVEHLFQRVMAMGEFQTYSGSQPPTAWVELRHVAGTEPAAPPRLLEPPF